jgi:hypothetical protein
MIVLGIILVLIVLVILFTLQLISKHAASDKLLVFYKDKRTQAKPLSKTDEKIEFTIDVPYANQSRDEGIFLDAFVRIYLPDEQYNGALLRGRVNHPDAPRTDDYFEARLVPPGEAGHLTVTFEVTPRNGKKTAKEALLGMPDVEVALYVERRGRMELFHNKENILLTKEELQQLLS